ncbi:hypothetical protein FACS18949_18320 [Clostridia bacterium]|nr:hypothetical protein FACS18949_18320 [Clostridia bacterium]
MRMRTQSEALAAVRAEDPDTALTPHALRQMVLSGQIPTVRAGRKYLLDLDRLPEYLAAQCEQAS